MPIQFKKASLALYGPDNRLYINDPETGEHANMVWITIKNWISDTEVEVEVGWRFGPLANTVSTAIYAKVDGKWEIKRYLRSLRS